MKKGKFIVIEGTDGSGKATQTRLLAATLRRRGKKVRTIAFPQYGQKSAGAVEAYLNGVYGTPQQVGTYRAAIFYAVDRAAARMKILSWLNQENIVIADRYLASNWAYGGALLSRAARRKYWRWDKQLEFGLFNIPKPDRTVVLAVPPKIAQKLILQKHRRQYLKRNKRDAHEQDIRYQGKVLETYRELARLNREIRVVECIVEGRLLSKREIHERVRRALRGVV
ncbi:MAG: thymidylate kinase [Candidatus Kerfeldbacteria bacterium]|nr:thymidylate kinase [Candidatus Kerfeldbacteria bacterium]